MASCIPLIFLLFCSVQNLPSHCDTFSHKHQSSKIIGAPFVSWLVSGRNKLTMKIGWWWWWRLKTRKKNLLEKNVAERASHTTIWHVTLEYVHPSSKLKNKNISESLGGGGHNNQKNLRTSQYKGSTIIHCQIVSWNCWELKSMLGPAQIKVHEKRQGHDITITTVDFCSIIHIASSTNKQYWNKFN